MNKHSMSSSIKTDYDQLTKEKDAEIQHLIRCTEILKEHLDYLREKLKEKDEQIEIFSAAIIAMDDELKRPKFFDIKKISLN
jgi:hypothetical protein